MQKLFFFVKNKSEIEVQKMKTAQMDDEYQHLANKKLVKQDKN